jgi:hypothetical protein
MSFSMKSTLFLIITIFIQSQLASEAQACRRFSNNHRIRLSEVSSLTFYSGRMRTGRRSSVVPQLECVGGDTGCHRSLIPSSVKCDNRGHDAVDVQWKCTAKLDKAVEFGSVSVSCEGFDYPQDPFVLNESCGLQYELVYTTEGLLLNLQRNYGHHHPTSEPAYSHHNYDYYGQRRWYDDGWSWTDRSLLSLFWFIIFILALACILSCVV